MTAIPPPDFRIRYTKISVQPNSESQFFIMDPGSFPFQTTNGQVYYIIREHALGVVSDREINPLRMYQKGARGDYLFVDVRGNLAIMSAEKAKVLLKQ